MRFTTWPPDSLYYLNPATDPNYQVEPSWFTTHPFEYRLALVLAAVLIILGVARIIWTAKRK